MMIYAYHHERNFTQTWKVLFVAQKVIKKRWVRTQKSNTKTSVSPLMVNHLAHWQYRGHFFCVCMCFVFALILRKWSLPCVIQHTTHTRTDTGAGDLLPWTHCALIQLLHPPHTPSTPHNSLPPPIHTPAPSSYPSSSPNPLLLSLLAFIAWTYNVLVMSLWTCYALEQLLDPLPTSSPPPTPSPTVPTPLHPPKPSFY